MLYDTMIVVKKGTETLVKNNDFQPGFRGTPGYREHFLGLTRDVEIKKINNITSLINA
jgi:hypothetical protein